MRPITLKDLQKLTGVEIVNKKYLSNRSIKNVSTDSRTIEKDSLFVALKGERFDAHDFIQDVARRKVVGVVASKEWSERNKDIAGTLACSLILVPDTTIAYGELGKLYRRKFDIPVVAIAGSNGKTTTKGMVSRVLQEKYNVLSTEGNLNNHIGVPQTLFRLTSKHEAAVVELGTNHPGELEYLCGIAEPTHGVITNIGKEHLEFFGDEAGVAKEEITLFRYLEKTNGIAFVNNDDPLLSSEMFSGKKSIRYGVDSTSDIRAKKIEIDELGRPSFQCLWRKKDKSVKVSLSVSGMHTVSNALAAASIGLQMKVKEKKIAEALNNFSPASKRMEVLKANGIVIVNDSYNSNPDSVIAALKTVQSMSSNGRKVIVLGDMKELGEASAREHTNIGAIASEMNFSKLYTFGPFSKYTCDAYGKNAEHYESKSELAEQLKKELHNGDIVLIKGSRGMKMEEVAAQLTGTNETAVH